MSKTLLAIIGAVIVLVGAATAVIFTQNDSDVSNSKTSKSESTDAIEKASDDAMEKNPNLDIMDTEDSAMMQKTTTYVTLADYESSRSEYAETNKVLFFHASWCSVCQGIEKEINADPSRIPTGTTFIKTDYDENTELRQKYGVTYQYTFVQIDNDGNQIAKWSATNLDKAISGVEV